MNDARQVVTQLFQQHKLVVPKGREALFQAFIERDENKQAVEHIVHLQNEIMTRWKREERLAAIQQQSVRILNATVGKSYEALLDFEKLDWQDVTEINVAGLEPLGLRYDVASQLITGTPTQSGDYTISLRFKLQDDAPDATPHEKPIPFIINPDPKSLWKNLPSDRNDAYWKEDDVTVFVPFNDKHLLVSSKRGRSHANIGSFREDDFGYKELDNGWSVVVVSDGAGSAKASRKGSALACTGIVDYFSQPDVAQELTAFDDLIDNYTEGAEEAQKALYRAVYTALGKAAFQVHKSLQAFAQSANLSLKDLSATLVFVLMKKYKAGYALLSFGVGDCPMAVLTPDQSEVHLMNWIDVGEFTGGTRFITMPEIFGNDKFATRFGFKLMPEFSYLVLMSDGIYDPKFSVEAALADVSNWKAFFEDLSGGNEDKAAVELRTDNPQITEQFSRWMDFWSPGNHDDRTLAIVF